MPFDRKENSPRATDARSCFPKKYNQQTRRFYELRIRFGIHPRCPVGRPQAGPQPHPHSAGGAGRPHKRLRFVHVAGTNGKGSTAAMLASCLQAAGYRVGLYTSPFINRFNERIQVNGEQIPDDALVRLVERVRPAADAMADVPTEFEIITALGMLWFAEEKCDIVVLEVGLGGTLDSTNIIDPPECAVITALGMDHVKNSAPPSRTSPPPRPASSSRAVRW